MLEFILEVGQNWILILGIDKRYTICDKFASFSSMPRKTLLSWKNAYYLHHDY